MKTKLRGKENTSSEFNKMMHMEAFVSDYEFIYQMSRMNIEMDVAKKGGKRK